MVTKHRIPRDIHIFPSNLKVAVQEETNLAIRIISTALQMLDTISMINIDKIDMKMSKQQQVHMQEVDTVMVVIIMVSVDIIMVAIMVSVDIIMDLAAGTMVMADMD